MTLISFCLGRVFKTAITIANVIILIGLLMYHSLLVPSNAGYPIICEYMLLFAK
jgi:hypothetical protein